MADTKNNLEQLTKLFLGTREKMEAQRKKPPKIDAPIELKVETLTRIKKRVESLEAAKLEAVQQFDAQIQAQRKRIVLLEKEIKEDRKKIQKKNIGKKTTKTAKKPTKKRIIKKNG